MNPGGIGMGQIDPSGMMNIMPGSDGINRMAGMGRVGGIGGMDGMGGIGGIGGIGGMRGGMPQQAYP